jgi:hypothetical protein
MQDSNSRVAHSEKVELLAKQIGQFKSKGGSSLSLQYSAKQQANTSRSKSYKKSAAKLQFETFDEILHIDKDRRIAVVEPRVTMQKLVQTTLCHGLIPLIVPEFKGITVGGAILGEAAESSSHHWGTFANGCAAFEVLTGEGRLLRLSPSENSDLFHAFPGSYGSLGTLVLAEVKLVPAKEFVHLRSHFYSNPLEAVSFLQQLVQKKNTPDFLDGMVFSKNSAVIIEGSLQTEKRALPTYSSESICADWYYHHIEKMSTRAPIYEEVMTISDYLFRYDRGAFWMGAYLFRLSLLARFVGQGIFKCWDSTKDHFSEEQLKKLHRVQSPNLCERILFYPWLTSQKLWQLFHQAEKWIQDRCIIQDFCIPERDARKVLEDVLKDPGTFPLWLCPIKGTKAPQIFAPHLLSDTADFTHFINIGIYGLPSYSAPIEEITRSLEQKTTACGGRKVLYSRSYYTEEEFWKIYSRPAYTALRQMTRSDGVWHDITEKVLSR